MSKIPILLAIIVSVVSCSKSGGGSKSTSTPKVTEVTFESIVNSSVVPNESLEVNGTCKAGANNVPFVVIVGGIRKEATCTDSRFSVTYLPNEIPEGGADVKAVDTGDNLDSKPITSSNGPISIVRTPCNGNQNWDTSACEDRPVTTPEVQVLTGQEAGGLTYINNPTISISLGQSKDARSAYIFQSASACLDFRSNNCFANPSNSACQSLSYEEIPVVGLSSFNYSLTSTVSGAPSEFSVLLANGTQGSNCMDNTVIYDNEGPSFTIANEEDLTRSTSSAPRVVFNGESSIVDASGPGIEKIQFGISSDGITDNALAFQDILSSLSSFTPSLSGMIPVEFTQYYTLIKAIDKLGNENVVISNAWRYTTCNSFQDIDGSGNCLDKNIGTPSLLISNVKNEDAGVKYMSASEPIRFDTDTTTNAKKLFVFQNVSSCNEFKTLDCHTVGSDMTACGHIAFAQYDHADFTNAELTPTFSNNTPTSVAGFYTNESRHTSCLSQSVVINVPEAGAPSSSKPLIVYQLDESTATTPSADNLATISVAVRPRVAGILSVANISGTVDAAVMTPDTTEILSFHNSTIDHNVTVTVPVTNGKIFECIESQNNVPCSPDTVAGNFTSNFFTSDLNYVSGSLKFFMNNEQEVTVPYKKAVLNRLTSGWHSSGENLNSPVVYNGWLYFITNMSGSSKIFRTDGTVFQQVANMNTAGHDTFTFPIVFEGELYFGGVSTATSGRTKLFKYNSTTNVITQISNLAGAQNDIPQSPVVANGKLYYSLNANSANSSDYSKLYEIGATNLTQITQLNGAADSDYISSPMALGNDLYFRGVVGGNTKLFRLSGSTLNRMGETRPGSSEDPELMMNYNGVLYYVSKNSTSDEKLYKYVGNNITKVIDTYSWGDITTAFVHPTDGIYISSPTADGNKVFLVTDTSVTQVTNTNSGASDNLTSMTVCGGKTFFALNVSGSDGLLLMKEGDHLVRIAASRSSATYIGQSSPLMCLDNSLIFASTSSTGYNSIYKLTVTDI